MERAQCDAPISSVACNIALEIIGAKSAMARATVIRRKRRRRNFRRSDDTRLPIDCDPELIGKSAGRLESQIRMRTLEIDHDREVTLADLARCRAFGGEIRVNNIRRRAIASGEHPSDSRKMFSPEKNFTANNICWYSEYSRVEGFALDAVVKRAALASRVFMEARGSRASLIEHALDDSSVFEVEVALPKTLVHQTRVGAEHRSILISRP